MHHYTKHEDSIFNGSQGIAHQREFNNTFSGQGAKT